MKLDEQTRTILMSIPDMIFLINREGIFLEYKSAWDDLLVPPEAFIGKNISEVLPSDVAVSSLQKVSECLGNNEMLIFEYALSLPEKGLQYFECRMIPFSGQEVLTIVRNISDKKFAEEKSRESEANARAVMEATKDVIVLLDRDGRIIDCNEAHAKRLNIPRDQLIGRNVFSLLPDDVSRKRREKVEQVFRDGKSLHFEDSRADFWHETVLNPVYGVDGTVKNVAVFSRDVTEVKKAREMLLSSYSLLEIAGKTAKFGGWSLDIASNTVTWSDEVAVIHEMPVGYSPDLEEGISFYTPDYRSVIAEKVDQCMKHGIPFDEILQITTPSNPRKWVRATGLAIRNSDHQITTIQGSFQDIQELKTAESLLLDAKKYAENLIRTANAIVVGMDINGNIHTFNQTAERISGYTAEELHNRNWFATLCPKDQFPDVWELFEKTSSGNLPKVFENPIITKNGEEKIILWHNNEIVENEKITGTISFGLDVTAQRLSEKLSEVRLRLIEYSMRNSLDDLLEEMLNEAERLTSSRIGFVHFVEDDQQHLTLQNWSKRTKNEYCDAEGKGAHYTIQQAGVWVDCVYTRKPVIHNDYNSLKHKKGLPEGHAEVIRELVVPVIRGEKIKAILGVGNKKILYTQQDVDTLQMIANLTWDIAERLSAEKALLESENRFHKVFDTSPIGMILMSEKGQIIQVNPSFCRFSGFSDYQIKSKILPELLFEGSDEFREDFNLFLSGKSTCYVKEILFTCEGNQPKWGMLQMTVIEESESESPHFLAMIEDIDERKCFEQEILRINAELKEAIQTKDKFFSIIAHDLRSPFSSIIGLSDMLRNEVHQLDSHEIERLAGLLSKSAGQTLQLLDNLLNWARMQQGRMEYRPDHVLFRNIVEDAIWALDESAKQKSITIHNKVPPKSIIHADENMITGVVRNLISNAIKFTHPGGKVEIRIAFRKDEVNIAIADSGVGMTADQKDKVFYVGSNVSTKGTANEKGTGLGLILCREFIERHSGKIWVESAPGQGTTMHFSLPVERTQHHNLNN